MKLIAFVIWGLLFAGCFSEALLYGAVCKHVQTAQWQAATVVWFFGFGALALKLLTVPFQITPQIWSIFILWLLLGPTMLLINEGIEHYKIRSDSPSPYGKDP